MDSMYEILLNLPLFKGASHDRISEIAEKAKFHFLKYLPGQQLITAGDACTHIKFVISGKVRLSIASSDGRFRVSQTLAAPDVIAPEFLFGRHTAYPCDAVAIEPAGILQIDKNDYIRILNSDPVFLFNFLNTLSMNAQKAIDGVLALTNGALDERIAFWIVSLTQPRATDITLTCRQRDLYSLFGVQRSSFIATMERMRRQGLIDYTQTEIRILSRRGLLDLLALGQ